MKTLTYKVACKSCLYSDGISHMMSTIDPNDSFIENRIRWSEYKFEMYIKKFLKANNKPCFFCGSNNLEINDIQLDGKSVSVSQKTDQLQLVFNKRPDGQVETRNGGSVYVPDGFLKEAFVIIENTITNTPNNEFEDKKVGSTRIVVSTGFIGNDNYRTTRLEQFSFVGFSKDLLLRILASIKPQLIK
jgi:hypothetical protein